MRIEDDEFESPLHERIENNKVVLNNHNENSDSRFQDNLYSDVNDLDSAIYEHKYNEMYKNKSAQFNSYVSNLKRENVPEQSTSNNGFIVPSFINK